MLALVRLDGLGRPRRRPNSAAARVQRVALARALAAEPSVLLLDEPLSALDLKLRQQMQLELRAIQRKLGATFVFVTHDQTEALVMSDRIAIMDRGRIVQVGTPREIYMRPASIFASDFIGQTNLLKGTVVESGGGVATLRTRRRPDAPRRVGGAARRRARRRRCRSGRRRSGSRGHGAAGEGEGLARHDRGDHLSRQQRARTASRPATRWSGSSFATTRREGLVPGEPVVLTWKPSAATVWTS